MVKRATLRSNSILLEDPQNQLQSLLRDVQRKTIRKNLWAPHDVQVTDCVDNDKDEPEYHRP